MRERRVAARHGASDGREAAPRRASVATAMAVVLAGAAGSAAALGGGQAVAPSSPAAPRLGQPLTPAEVTRIDTSVFPDGRGLPAGSGTAVRGEPVYRAQCVRCHGAGGRGASAPELAGGTGALTSADPDKTIGLYWPYATTLFDYIRRSMPMGAPWSLSADDTYAVTAYLLWLDGLVARDAVLDAGSLAAVHMPNRDGFDPIDAGRPRP